MPVPTAVGAENQEPHHPDQGPELRARTQEEQGRRKKENRQSLLRRREDLWAVEIRKITQSTQDITQTKHVETEETERRQDSA